MRTMETVLEQEIQALGIKPTELAAKADVSYRYLLLIRRGETEPTVSRAIRVARAMSKLSRKRYTVEDLWPTAA
jgi:predicted transcriptional regulator